MLDTTKSTALCLFVALASSLVGCAADTDETSTEGETTSSESSIIGGTVTNDYPAVGALTRFGQSFCTGTVVAPRLVVTAAHCLADLGGSSIRFALGTRASAPEASVAVRGYAAHPSYDARQIRNDIGVVVLAEDAPVAPVAVNSSMTAEWVGHSLEFVGFGATNGFTGSGSGTKRAVTIPVSQVGATQFAYVDRSRNTCFGDSGGPAFARGAEGQLVLVGVTSYGDARCTQFGVDTRVDAYRSFIAAALDQQ
jgi:secreted trypsin-like serine protease